MSQAKDALEEVSRGLKDGDLPTVKEAQLGLRVAQVAALMDISEALDRIVEALERQV